MIFPELKKGVTGKSRKTHIIYDGLVKLQEQQWVDSTKNALNANEHVRDVQTAEDLLNKHAKIGDEIRANQDEFGSLIQLGLKMYRTEIVEVNNFVAEKRKLVTEDSFRDGILQCQGQEATGVGGRDKSQCWAAESPQQNWTANGTEEPF